MTRDFGHFSGGFRWDYIFIANFHLMFGSDQGGNLTFLLSPEALS